jgi:hypothetical protein
LDLQAAEEFVADGSERVQPGFLPPGPDFMDKGLKDDGVALMKMKVGRKGGGCCG